MNNILLYSRQLEDYFLNKNYNGISPFSIVNNNDTIFLTAGIQPILREFRNGNLSNTKRLYISQPVIRTQFADSISEGSSIAFINSTTAGFNISEEEYDELVNDWLELFEIIGLRSSNITSYSKNYERLWGDLLVSGRKTFYYYNDLELGDTTFFTNVTKDGNNIGIDTMSDVGFGLERIRWSANSRNSYFDLYSDSKCILPSVKAYLSAIALLCVNDVAPSNKNSGYRFRLFSKKLAFLLDGKKLTLEEEKYLLECLNYWKDWQKVNKSVKFEIIQKEYIRNCNRYIIEKLTQEGYTNLSGININVSRDEMAKKLYSAGVEMPKIRKYYK